MDQAELPEALVERHIASRARDEIADFRITVVNGPRQAGKTTLLRQLHRPLEGTFVTFDDADQRSAARRSTSHTCCQPGHVASPTA